MTLPNKIADAKTPECLTRRQGGIGASESARACGLSDHGTPLDIYCEKTGEIEPFEGNDATRLGLLLEPVIQSEFEHRTGIKVIESPMGLYQSADNPFVLATPDADLETSDLAEWKSTNFRIAARLGEQETDDLPADWVCQCQQQMYVMDRQRVQVAVLIDGRTLKTYQVERNDRLIEGIIEAERELWQRIENRDPPEPDWQHPRTSQLIKEMYGLAKDEGTVKNISPAGMEAWTRKRQAGRLIRRIKAREEIEAAKVRAEIGKDFAVILPGGEKMIRRKRIIAEVSAHTKDYIDMREVNAPKSIFERH